MEWKQAVTYDGDTLSKYTFAHLCIAAAEKHFHTSLTHFSQLCVLFFRLDL